MSFRIKAFILCVPMLIAVLLLQVLLVIPVQAAGATSNVHIIKYAADGVTKIAEKTVSYEWMQKMLPVQGDGKTHYYHQGPIFEGDMWDSGKTLNLKDKGAVKGTAVKDLCDQVGGMSPGDEIMLVAVDGWHTEFAYNNIYQPVTQQGIITLGWYNGSDAQEGETYGVGYPGNNAYHSALQMVLMASQPNSEGKYVFGNSDMKAAFPEEKYQHFYDGQYPSSNGLSGKWIAEVRIYSGGIPAGLKIDYTAANYPPSNSSGTTGTSPAIPWTPIILGIIGILIIGLGVFILANLRRLNLKIASVFIVGIILLTSAVVVGINPGQEPATAASTSDNWKLTLSGANGESRTMSMDEIQAMHSCSGHGGFFTTVGVVNGPYQVKGVLLTDLCKQVGGVTNSDVVMISASDGYSTVLDYDQLMGNVVTYDLKTLKEIPRGDIKVLLMYQQDGKALSQDDGQPLRIAIVGPDNILTEGNNWVRWVNKIEVLKAQKSAN
jgi:hypothetical protein